MRRVRMGPAAVVFGLAAMSFGMRDLLAGDPCGPASYGVKPPKVDCLGECSAGKCQAATSALPGKPPLTMITCACSAGATASRRDCMFALFVQGDTVTPACVPTHCKTDCGTPKYSTQRGRWGCDCSK